MGDIKERPILFSAPMVRAILAGQKTMTRRVLKRNLSGRVERKGKQWHIDDHGCVAACPYGNVGERLWVRETFGHNQCANCPIHYRATEQKWKEDSINPNSRWYPSIHMPRMFSRINLEITDIKVELLNQISNADILREGIRSESCNICPHMGGSGCEQCFSIVKPFRELWDSINGKTPGKSWEDDPYVWAVSFRRVDS